MSHEILLVRRQGTESVSLPVTFNNSTVQQLPPPSRYTLLQRAFLNDAGRKLSLYKDECNMNKGKPPTLVDLNQELTQTTYSSAKHINSGKNPLLSSLWIQNSKFLTARNSKTSHKPFKGTNQPSLSKSRYMTISQINTVSKDFARLKFPQKKIGAQQEPFLKSTLSRILVKAEDPKPKVTKHSISTPAETEKKYPQFIAKWYDLRKRLLINKYYRKNFIPSNQFFNVKKHRLTARDLFPEKIQEVKLESDPPKRISLKTCTLLKDDPEQTKDAFSPQDSFMQDLNDDDEELELLKLIDSNRGKPNETDLKREAYSKRQVKLLNNMNKCLASVVSSGIEENTIASAAAVVHKNHIKKL